MSNAYTEVKPISENLLTKLLNLKKIEREILVNNLFPFATLS